MNDPQFFQIVKTAPSYRETNALLDVGGVDLVGVRGLVELLKLMPQDTLLLSRSLIGASDRQLYLIALVLTQFGVMDQGLFELKQAIDLPGGEPLLLCIWSRLSNKKGKQKVLWLLLQLHWLA